MTNPIVPWIGGKRRLVDLLLKRFPDHSCYVEVFAGGAAVYFARHPADVEVLNDVNGDLVNLYRVVTHHLEEFVRQFKWALTSRQVFKWLQETRPETLTDIQRAARFFYLQQQSFGGKVSGQTFGTATTAPAINLLRIEASWLFTTGPEARNRQGFFKGLLGSVPKAAQLVCHKLRKFVPKAARRNPRESLVGNF